MPDNTTMAAEWFKGEDNPDLKNADIDLLNRAGRLLADSGWLPTLDTLQLIRNNYRDDLSTIYDPAVDLAVRVDSLLAGARLAPPTIHHGGPTTELLRSDSLTFAAKSGFDEPTKGTSAMNETTSYAMNAKTRGGPVIGYMCRIDWECEIGAACDGNRVYPSADDLRHNHPCADSCGIVEVEVHFHRIIEVGTDNE